MGSQLIERAGHFRSRLNSLRRRREAQFVAAYVASAWLGLEIVSLLADTFGLSAVWVRGTFAFFAAGLVVSIPLARWYALVARELERTGGLKPDDIPAVPDVLEAALARVHQRVRPRTAGLAAACALVLFTGGFAGLWAQWAGRHVEPDDTARASIAVMLFEGRGRDADVYGEGLADILSVLLDGTPGVRVVSGVARQPTPQLAGIGAARGNPAIEAARRAGAAHAIIGRVVVVGETLDVTAQLVTTSNERVIASLRDAAPRDSIGRMAHRLALGVLPRVWRRETLPTVPELDQFATDDVDALKAYLEAKRLQRRGLMAEAEVAIERAIALDSTFALAHMEHFSIRSWLLYQEAQPFVGLREIVERALRHSDRLSPRNRLRVQAARSMDDTDGFRTAYLAERILELDSLDADALETLAFTYLRDGWQIGRRAADIVAMYDRLARIDPTSLSAQTFRAQLAIWIAEDEAALAYASRMAALDSTGVFQRATAAAIEVLHAQDDALAERLRAITADAPPVAITALRQIRTTRPDLAERLTDAMAQPSMPVFMQNAGEGARLQLWLAMGRLSRVDEALNARRYEPLRPVLQRALIAAQLAGVGDARLARDAVAELTRYAPVDSLEYYLNRRMVWQSAWAVAAWHATFGDTADARRWQRAIAALPQGGTPWDWTSSLAADIEARIAVRRGDLDQAERAARRAFDLWMIHASNAFEADPEPAMRLNLAEIHRARGEHEAAARYYRAVLPPHTWMGFLSTRAAYELGRLERERGDAEEATRYLTFALRNWAAGDSAVVGAWRHDAERELAALID